MLQTPRTANGIDVVNSTIVPKGILSETIAAVTDILGRELDEIAVERAVAGLHFSGVKLSTGHAGACATPHLADEAMCCPVSTGRAAYRPLRGRPAAELMAGAVGPDGISRALGIATLNALAELCWQRRPHPQAELRPGVDAFDASAIAAGEQVVIVGAFIPFLKELKRRQQPYLVLEQNPAVLKPEEMPFYRPAETAREVVPRADVLLITGSTLINNTLEDLLAWARPETRVTVVGPSVTMLPGPFLDRGADILGGVRIVAPDDFLDAIAEGAGAPQFLGRFAEKIVLARRQSKEAAKAA